MGNRIKTKQIVDGVPYEVTNTKWWYDECCDCGLVHRVKYEVKDGKMWITAWRHKAETKKARLKLVKEE